MPSSTVDIRIACLAAPRSFGRRTDPQHKSRQAKSEVEAAFPKAAEVATSPRDLPAPLDDELQEWTKARRNAFRWPWRQISLTASLCFGIASFALPDSINDGVQWLLYALMAATFFGGVAKRREAGR